MKTSAHRLMDTNVWTRLSKSRIWVAVGVAVVLLIFLPHGWPGELRGLSAWNGAVAVYLSLAWRTIITCDATRTRQVSRQEDEHRSIIDTLLLCASFVSLGGVLRALTHAGQAKDALAMHLTLAAIATVVLSWVLMHTIYAFHYARLYYDGPGSGHGVDFHSDEPPDYLDFCYLSFAVGTTFGATDSEIGGRPIRRTILKHGVLSFTFATVVVALAISVVSDLLAGS